MHDKKDLPMSKQTLLLIVFLTILTAFFVYLAVSQNKSQPASQSTVAVPTKRPSPAFTTLVLKPQQAVFPSSTGTVDVLINTNGTTNKVTAVQLEISYDPKVLTNVSVVPGTFLPKSTPLLNNVDKTTGHITYALAIQPSAEGKSGEGVVATISFTSRAPGSTELTLLPKTLVTAEGIAESVLKSAQSTKVTFSSSVKGTGSVNSIKPSPAVSQTP